MLLHARADAADSENLNVPFEDVRAVKLRSSYQPLILAPADNPLRNDILAFADMPQRRHHRYLSLTLSTRPEAGARSPLVVSPFGQRPFDRGRLSLMIGCVGRYRVRPKRRVLDNQGGASRHPSSVHEDRSPGPHLFGGQLVHWTTRTTRLASVAATDSPPIR